MKDLQIKNAIEKSRKILNEEFNLRLMEVNGIWLEIAGGIREKEIYSTDSVDDLVLFIKGMQACNKLNNKSE